MKKEIKIGDYTYDEVSKFAKTLYGSKFSQEIPTDNPAMIYYEDTNTYGIPIYNVEALKECQIESIEKQDNLYIVKIIDYTISFASPIGSNEENNIYFYNTLDYDLSSTSSDVVFKLKELKDYKNQILKNKDKFTSKTITLSYDGNYHIENCKYNLSENDIIKIKYKELLNSFNLYNLEYDINDFNDSIYSEITNFNEISSIYSTNGLNLYKNTFDLLEFKEDKTYITAGDFHLLENLFATKLSNITITENEITCTVTSYLFNDNYNISSLSELKQVTNEFKLVKENEKWKIDFFNLNF